jgi:hypothetical protein
MPKLSLTDFVDIVSKSGTPKATKVAQVKNRPKYDPATDFYKPIRDFFVELHKKKHPKSKLKSALTSVTDPKKLTNYPGIISGYSKWWGTRALTWFDPPADTFTAHGIDVAVNPELGLAINGKRHLVKLYFKSEPLAKTRAAIVIHLMEKALRTHCSQGELMAVLDTRKAKLIVPTVSVPHLNAVLLAELAYISALWPSV